MIINFECEQCNQVFDSDIGAVDFTAVEEEEDGRPSFEKAPNCPKCGELTLDQVALTELGQSQLTNLFMGSDDDY